MRHSDHPVSNAVFTMMQPTIPLPPPEPPPSRLSSKHNYNDEDDMADLPILVEDVSSDEESDDDQCSYQSTSSAGSYDDELKAFMTTATPAHDGLINFVQPPMDPRH